MSPSEVDAMIASRDAHLEQARMLERTADAAVARFDVRAGPIYALAAGHRIRALVVQRRLDARAGFGRWPQLRDLGRRR